MRSKNILPINITAAFMFLSILTGCVSLKPSPIPAATESTSAEELTGALRKIEAEFDATIGVSAIHTGSGAKIAYNADARFGFASTLKLFAAAEMMHEISPAKREKIITWSEADVKDSGYSPVTEKRVAAGMSLAQLGEAAVRASDNTAMNMLFNQIGGPRGLDARLERHGDLRSDVVDREPGLNIVQPSSSRNTSTPEAFTTTLVALLTSTYLTTEDRNILIDWMSGNATGDSLIRAGAPVSWVVADKSGGAGGMRNDVAIVTPPGQEPIVITILTQKNDVDVEYEDALVAAAARIALEHLN